jgi:hypothetical protein
MNNAATASEVKFILDEDTAAAIKEWSLKEMAGDPNAADSRGGYRTSSLYFDTENFDLFHRRGSTGRAKYRIRRYNGSPVVFLERKMRKGGRTSKRRSEVGVADLQRLADDREHWAGRWFARRLQHRDLLPVCQITYQRTARIAMSVAGSPNPLRLTLDRPLHATAVGQIGFTEQIDIDLLPGKAILELKYPATSPELFESLIERFHLKPQSLSKYRLAISALGLAHRDVLPIAK